LSLNTVDRGSGLLGTQGRVSNLSCEITVTAGDIKMIESENEETLRRKERRK
jgi:hypothetical protein